jgi:HEAT repeat protein
VLVLLGGYAMTPLLDALAEEPDMAGRKALVEILSEIAQPQMQVLAAHVSDPRWYFVRNVVSILGSTRSPEALAPLSRTIRHADARVRRESIRAVAGIRDRRAGELLVAVLHDEDAQNVGLAARYLGTLRVTAALPALAAVATGEGAGSRETSARLEAIEALGRLGVPEAGKVLKGIAHRKSLLRQSQAGALRLAAAAALAELDRTSHERDA